MARTTITDIPRKGVNDDSFGLAAYEKGLETFISGASTPITIALQGEWGSGKTSLMNVLRNDLCINSGEFFSVWINTWEYSLMRNSNEALLQILFKMASEVVALSQNTGEDTVKSIKKCLKIFGSAVARSLANKVVDGAYDKIVEDLGKEEENSIADLSSKLQDQIKACIDKNKGKKGIIFFIDDLDRIDPPVAVELLELLKNIFTLEHCVFILAIDYDVVIKGLKPKFGELNEKNEREFRSFFDKIIQVPFSMPVSQYSTEKYLIEELKRIEVLGSADFSDKSLTNKLNRAEHLTVGHNPRSIKRFLNTLSLIKCISGARQDIEKADRFEQEKENDNVRKLNILLNLAIVGIQIAYPKVYQLLCLEPGFTKWNDKIASKMGIPRIDEQTSERLKLFNEFDETWEQILYRLCLTDKYLQNNAVNISQLLNMIREEIKIVASTSGNNENEEEKTSEEEIIREHMLYQMSQASITNYAASGAESLDYDAAQLMRDVQWILLQHVKSEPKFKGVEFSVPRVRYNGGIRTKGNYPDLSILQKRTSDQKISFEFHISSSGRKILLSSGKQFMPAKPIPNNYYDDITTSNVMDLPIFNDFKNELKTVSSSDCYKLWADRHINKSGIWFNLHFRITFDNPDAFLEETSIKTMKDVTRIFFDIMFNLYKI